jgi:D-tyrosyl-tRNA(Tyr) deacylase
MKIVLQRVNEARVEVDGETVGAIGKGYAVFLGIADFDDKTAVEKIVDKIFRLRIFADANGKTNLSASDVGGEILVVSQFTLMAELNSNRPSFSRAAKPEAARELYEYFLEQCEGKFAKVAGGRFGAHMHVYAHNDGPFTLVLEG